MCSSNMKLILKAFNLSWIFLFSTHVFANQTLLHSNSTINLESKLDNFQLKFHNKLEDIRIRRARTSGENSYYSVPFVSARESETSVSDQSIAVVSVVNVNGADVAFGGTEEGNIVLFQDADLIPLVSFPSNEKIYSLLSFQFVDRLWLVGLHNRLPDEHFLQVYEYSNTSDVTNSAVVRRQRINLTGGSLISLVNAKNRIHLLLVTNTDINSVLSLYRWTGTHFDVLLSVTLKGKCKSVSTWESNKILFMAVSLFDEKQLHILQLKENEDRVVSLLQILEGAFHFVYHFKFAGSQYLICEKENKLSFFWWNGAHFQAQQEISFTDSDPVIDISMLVLSRALVVVLVVKPNRLEYYVQDSSVSFTSSGSTDLPESWKIKSARVWRKDGVFYLLPVFQHRHEAVRFILDIQFREISSDLETTKLFDCASEVDKTLDGFETALEEVSSKLDNVWMKSVTSHLPFITVEGNVVSNTAHINKVSFEDEDTASVASLIRMHKLLFNKVNNFHVTLNGTLRKSSYQEIKGHYKFEKKLNVFDANINSFENDLLINSVVSSSLQSVLKTGGDQMFLKNMSIGYASAKVVNTDILNSKETTDYLLLNDTHQIMRGGSIFKDITVENLSKTETLNKITLNELVTSSTPQVILDTKMFELLSSKIISLNGTINGEDINKFKNLASKSNYEKKLRFISDVIVNNLTIRSLNGYSATDLFFKPVKRSEDNIIKGLKTFTLPLHIQDEASFSYINGLNLSHLMTLDSEQNIMGKVEFMNVSFSKVKSQFVNGIDLSSEAIRKSGYFEVKRVVQFKQPMTVTDITMKDGATIDGIDLSELVPHIMRKRNATFDNAFELENVHVSNDLVIEDERIASLLLNFSNNVWLKSKSQDIPYGYFKIFYPKQLHLNTWNSIPVENIVLCNFNVDVDSAKIFEDVQVNSILIKDGKTFNGIDFSERSLYPSFIDALHHFKTSDILIEGDLDLSLMNLVNISDLMQSRAFQYSNGVKEFKNILYVNELRTDVLYLTTFGNESFMDYILRSAHPMKQIIANKDFEFLKGKELDIQGFLNGRSLQNLLQSIVTLNTNQRIFSNKSFNALNAKVVHVNNLEDYTDISNIVVTDRFQSNISIKEFTGFIIVDHMELDGTINNINLTELKMVAVSKRKNNTISQPVIFQSSLKTSKLQVSKSATIDNMKFEDLIRTDEDSDLEYMNTSTINTQNVYINGKINGCNLLDIYDGQGDLEILAEKYFLNLNIVGDLNIKGSLSSITEEDLSIVASEMYLDTLYGNFYFQDINVTYLLVPTVNGIDIQFILEDAVVQDTLQEIQGRKKFRRGIFSNITYANLTNVASICGINIPLLYRKYVSKEKNQNLYLKNLQNLKVQNIAIVGLLNGIKLPSDLVLVDTDEMISGSIIWNNTMTISSNFDVEGFIDEVEFLQFLDDVVYVGRDEAITSNLTFSNDIIIEGDADIDMINGIALNETVMKFQKASIHGIKMFEGSLSLQSGVEITGSVSNISLEELSENICRTDANEVIPNTVYFSHMKTSELNVFSINNISLEHLWNRVHDVEEDIFATTRLLTSDINHREETISAIKEHRYSQLLVYAFFELYQVMNLGPTLRFIPMYEAGVFGDSFSLPTVEMVMWVERNSSCRSFKSIIMNVHPDGSLSEKERVNARVFLFSLRLLDEDIQGFHLYADRNNRCKVNEAKPNFIKTILTSGGHANKNILNSPPKSVLVEAKMLEMDSGIYILITYDIEGDGERIYLHKYNLDNDTWLLHQKFHSWEISSFDVIYVDYSTQHEVHLAVTGDTKSGLFRYDWDFASEMFYVKTSSSKSISSAVKWVSTDKEVFLLLTKERTKIWKDYGWTFEYIDPVEVLLDDLRLHHEISIQAIHSFEEFDLAGETFVLAVSRHLQTIYVIQYKGFHGFEVIQQINAPGVLEVTVFSSLNGDLLLAISSSTGHTRVLKCVTRSSKAYKES